MENSICTPQKKEGFRTASKVALKKKGALFGHSSVDAEYLPASQAVQTVVCPVDAEYVPAAQAVHAAEPAIVVYVPAAQASHVEVPV